MRIAESPDFSRGEYVKIAELATLNYDFDKCCPFPHDEEEILEPDELIENYLNERVEIEAEIKNILQELVVRSIDG